MREFNTQLVEVFLRICLGIGKHVLYAFICWMFYIIYHVIPWDGLGRIVNVFYDSMVGDVMFGAKITRDKPHGTHPEIA